MISVLAGGALGAAARYLIGEVLQKLTLHSKLPLPIILINLIGAFLLGLLASIENRTIFLFFATGFCGGFTTFSTFSVEVVTLLRRKKYLLSFLYVAFTIIGSVLGVFLGTFLTVD